MICIVCLDENNGILFNNRRQSRDKNITSHILEKTKKSKLWINSFSKDIFEVKEAKNVFIDDNFLEKIGKNEYCFIENLEISYLINKIDKIIVYSWNRIYPADKYFDISLDEWELESKYEFKGFSHEKITEKIYVRGNK